MSQASDEKVSQNDKKPLPENRLQESILLSTTTNDGAFAISEEIQNTDYQPDVEDSSLTENSETLSQLQTVMEDMKEHLLQNDQDVNMVSGIKKFLNSYQNVQTSSATAKLASALYQFAWSPKEVIGSAWFVTKRIQNPCASNCCWLPQKNDIPR